MPPMTIQEARRAVLVAHPDWGGEAVERAAEGILATEARLAAQDALDAQLAALQAEADQRNAAAKTVGLSGHIGGAASVWDALRADREQALWQDFAERVAEREAQDAEREAQDARPKGWSY